MLLFDFQLRILRLAGEMMGAAAEALSPAPVPCSDQTKSDRDTTASTSLPGDAAVSGSTLLMFPQLANGISRTLSEVQPAPRRGTQSFTGFVPFAALFPLASFPAVGNALPTLPFFAWPAPSAPHTALAVMWPALFGVRTMAWASPWTSMLAWTRLTPFPFGSAHGSLSPFMMGPWALPALRAWAELASASAPAQNASAYRSASGYAVAQIAARALLLAAGSLMAMAMAVDTGMLA